MSLCLHPSVFINAFLLFPPEGPSHPKPPAVNFKNVLGFKSERDLAERWVACVNENKSLCPGHVVCLSKECWSPSVQGSTGVDGAIYIRRRHPTDGRAHWSRQRALVKFTDGGPDNDPFFDLWSDKYAHQRAAVVAYASHVMVRQQRTAHFIFMINCSKVRVVRWDHAGPTYTEAFDYVQRPELMCEFLWRFSMRFDEDQGLDFSAKPLGKRHKWYKLMDAIAQGPLDGQPEDISEEEGTVIPLPSDFFSHTVHLGEFKYIRQMFAASLDGDWPRYRVAVPTDRPTQFKYFLIAKPSFQPPTMLGRGTRGYVAVDVDTKRFVWLKDTWRPYYAGVRSESDGDILCRLHEAQVPNIPTVVCAGDIGNETLMHYYWKPGSDNLDQINEDGQRLKRGHLKGTYRSANRQSHYGHKYPRRLAHYRLVANEVCLHLERFGTSRQLIQVLLDCVEAHETAFTRTQYLHRNISISSILILPTLVRDEGFLRSRWTGLLADWDRSKDTPEDGTRAAQHLTEREANWKFSSAAVQCWAHHPTDVEDDIESFLNIILYTGLRFFQSNLRLEGSARLYLRQFFDRAYVQKGERQCGVVRYNCMSRGILQFGFTKLWFLPDGRSAAWGSCGSHPFNTILDGMLPPFKARYEIVEYDYALIRWDLACKVSRRRRTTKPNPPPNLPQSVYNSAAFLETHSHFNELLRHVLREGDWPTEDYIGDVFRAVGGDDSDSSCSSSDGEANNSDVLDSGDESVDDRVKRWKAMTEVDTWY